MDKKGGRSGIWGGVSWKKVPWERLGWYPLILASAAASINNIFIILCFIKRNSFLRLSFNTYQIRSCFDFGKRKSPGSLLGVKLNLKFDVRSPIKLFYVVYFTIFLPAFLHRLQDFEIFWSMLHFFTYTARADGYFFKYALDIAFHWIQLHSTWFNKNFPFSCKSWRIKKGLVWYYNDDDDDDAECNEKCIESLTKPM